MEPINPTADQQNPPVQPLEASIPEPKERSPFFSFFKKPPFLIGLAVIILAGLGTGGFLLASKSWQTTKHLKATTRKVATPTPTPDPTANWPVYTDSLVKLSMKYPPLWKTLSQEPKNFSLDSLSYEQTLVDIVPPDYRQDPSGVLVGGVFAQIVKRDPSISFTDWVNQHGYTAPSFVVDTANPITSAYTPIIINNHKALKYSFTQTQELYNKEAAGPHGELLPVGYKSEYVYVDDGDFILEFEAFGHIKNPDPDLRLFDQMLSTLTFTPLFIHPTPVVQTSYTDKYFGYSINYPKTWIFRRTYGPDIQKGAPTDIVSGIDLTYNTGSGNNLMTQATIVVNVLASHGYTDIEKWIDSYDLNYPKDATRTTTTFAGYPALKYTDIQADKTTEYFYFLAGKYAYRVTAWESPVIRNATTDILTSFAPGK